LISAGALPQIPLGELTSFLQTSSWILGGSNSKRREERKGENRRREGRGKKGRKREGKDDREREGRGER